MMVLYNTHSFSPSITISWEAWADLVEYIYSISTIYDPPASHSTPCIIPRLIHSSGTKHNPADLPDNNVISLLVFIALHLSGLSLS